MSRVTRRNLLIGTGGAAAGLVAAPAAHGRRDTRRQLWESEIVHYDGGGRLVYERDADGNRMPDFSHAGYRNGEEPIPDVTTVLEISPVDGDNTAHIQAAMDQVGARALDENGIRGAVVLRAGTYQVAGTIRVNYDGVVLRGVGDGEDPAANTIIHATGNTPAERNVIEVGAGGTDGAWASEVPGSRTDILTGEVLVGDRHFVVADASALRVGDPVIIRHEATQAWLDAIDGGGTQGCPACNPVVPDRDPWKVGSRPIVYNRTVRSISGNRITVDVPVFNHLRRELSPSYIYKWDRDAGGLATNLGVEDLRVDIAYQGEPDQDENHARTAIAILQAQDVWVRNCTMLHFVLSGVETIETTRATIADCRALDPVSRIAGGRRYNFRAHLASQQILFVDCEARRGRHSFVVNGTSTASGVVFLRTVATESISTSESHQRWAQGLLFDNHREIDPSAGVPVYFGNRGGWGTGHGWSTVHSVAWNVDVGAARIGVQQPPTAQNFAIGCRDRVSGAAPWTGWPDQPVGYIEGTGRLGLNPASLYEAQLADRLT